MEFAGAFAGLHSAVANLVILKMQHNNVIMVFVCYLDRSKKSLLVIIIIDLFKVGNIQNGYKSRANSGLLPNQIGEFR